MSLPEHAQRQLDRTRELYDTHSADMLACAGHTFQCRVVRPEDTWREDLQAGMRWMADKMGVQPTDRVLDAGCGVCGPASDLASLYPGVTVDAVTVSPVQVELAKGVIAKAGVEGRVRPQVADYHDLPFDDDTFDHVMFLETVGYSYDHHKAFREIFRVLKPGGKVYVKDVYRIETPLTPQQKTDLDAMEELWASGPVCSMNELSKVFTEVGFVDVGQHVIENVGGYRYTGAMMEPDGAGGLQLNAFGRRFYQTYADLPTLIGHVVGSTPL